MRILAVDPGAKRIGLAISDPSGTIANPLSVIEHVSRLVDAGLIAALAVEHGAEMIIVGQALDEDDRPTPQSRRAANLAETIRVQSGLPVQLWDESGSTQAALSAHIALGGSRRKRQQRGHGHLDDLAATYILQTFLDSQDKR
jgi:putative Holliday junction resolvase